MGKKSLQLQQLNKKMLEYVALKKVVPPPTGWVKAIRNALSISMEQLGRKLSMSRQGVRNLEEREKDGTVSLNSLKDVARVLDMQLVYGFVPNAGDLETLIEKRAIEIATQIVMRTANTMTLEGQANSKQRLEKAIQERAEEIQKTMPKFLWD